MKQLYSRQGGLCPAVFMLCNFAEFCLAARRFSSTLICPCSWMHRGLFQCQRNRLTFRPFALRGKLTNWKKTEVLLYLSKKRIQSGQQAEGGLEWLCWNDTFHRQCPTEGQWWGPNAGLDRDFRADFQWVTQAFQFLESLFIYVAFSHQEF